VPTSSPEPESAEIGGERRTGKPTPDTGAPIMKALPGKPTPETGAPVMKAIPVQPQDKEPLEIRKAEPVGPLDEVKDRTLLKAAIAEKTAILLLLRGDFKASQRALIECKNAGRTVVVSLKETGLHQIAEQMSNGGKIARFLDMMLRADGCLATTPESADLYRQARGKADRTTVGFAPIPYPLEDSKWNFAVQPDRQKGVFVGTREWEVPSRNHFAALLLARRISDASGEPVTVFNMDGWRGARRLASLGFPDGKL